MHEYSIYDPNSELQNTVNADDITVDGDVVSFWEKSIPVWNFFKRWFYTPVAKWDLIGTTRLAEGGCVLRGDA